MPVKGLERLNERIGIGIVPLRLDEGQVIRVGVSRVSLDVIVQQYENGMTPEQMVEAYDTLNLADVYGAIAFYLRHRDEVQSYLDQRAKEASDLRTKIESERPRMPADELAARSRVSDHASTRHSIIHVA
jgi:uncharacterized protein (DUF433 family)